MPGQVADQRFESFQYEAPAPAPVAEPSPLFQRIDKEAVMQAATSPAAGGPVRPGPRPPWNCRP